MYNEREKEELVEGISFRGDLFCMLVGDHCGDGGFSRVRDGEERVKNWLLEMQDQ